VQARDPQRALWLVGQLAPDLLNARGAPGELSVSDAYVQLKLAGAVTDPARLGPALDLVAALAARLAAAAAPLGVVASPAR
jgi:hypothetical protein